MRSAARQRRAGPPRYPGGSDTGATLGINENRNSSAAGIAIEIEEDGAADVKRLYLGGQPDKRTYQSFP
jgi:hypothetical protein